MASRFLQGFASVFTKTKDTIRAKAMRITDIFGGMYSQVELGRFDDYGSYETAATKKVWVLWKCSDIISKAVKDTPYLLSKRGSEIPITVKGLSELLARPNPQCSWSEFLYLLSFSLNVTGNFYIAKIEPNQEGDMPKSLYVLNPKLVRIKTAPTKGIIGYEYTINGHIVPFGVEEIIHGKIPHIDKEFYGIGPVEAAEDLYNEYTNRSTWASKFWANGASPSGVLINESDAGYQDAIEFEKAKEKWQKQYGGRSNAGKTAWLTGKWSYTQLGLTAVEMQHLENSKWNVEQIANVNGVPLSVLGLRDATSYATASIDNLNFRQNTVKPFVFIIQEALQNGLVNGYGDYQITFNVSGLTDTQSAVANFIPVFDRGAISLNELRELVGLRKKDDPNFEQHYINASLVPLEIAGLPQSDQLQQQQAALLVENFGRRRAEVFRELSN